MATYCKMSYELRCPDHAMCIGLAVTMPYALRCHGNEEVETTHFDIKRMKGSMC